MSQPSTLCNVLRNHAATQPSALATIFQGRKSSYSNVDQRSNQIANALISADIAPGARIALLDFNSDLFLECFFGVVKARGTLVAVNARLAPPEISYIINDAGAEVLFVGADHHPVVEQIEAELGSVHTIITMTGVHRRWPTLEAWFDPHTTEDPQLDEQPDDEIIQLYTSGTTGKPKGICHTNRRHTLALAALRATWAKFTPATVNLITAPTFHIAGFNCLCLTLLGGGTNVLTRKSDPNEILKLLSRYKVTDTLWVPAVLLAVLSLPAAAETDFSSLKMISYGASPIPAALLDRAQRLFECDFCHVYGLTENIGVATYLKPEMHDPTLGKLRSVGKPYPGCELRVVDLDGRDCADGEVGEIILKAAWDMTGYWRLPTASMETIRDGWLHTGDAAYRDQDGYIYIHDRIKDMIICGGENVYPAEVESALFAHPSVADVAVVGVPDETWGEVGKALIVLAEGETLNEPILRAFARKRIAGFKVPKYYTAVDTLPRNASGKILRRMLKETT